MTVLTDLTGTALACAPAPSHLVEPLRVLSGPA